MSFYNEEEDEELRRVIEASAIEASLEDLNYRNALSLSSNETNNTLHNLDFELDIETITDDEIEDETDDENEDNIEDEINMAEDNIEDEPETELENIQQLNHEPMNNDDDLTIALQASLVDYHKTEEEILSEIQEKSLQTIEDDKKRKLQREQDLKKKDDEIMEKILQESYESNIALQTQSNTIINNSTINNEFDIDEEHYMNMILQQIKEEEVREKRMKELNTQTQELQQSRTLKEEQDLEYDKALMLDIDKEQKKKYKSEIKIEIKINSVNETIDKPLTKEEIRQARLAFYKQN